MSWITFTRPQIVLSKTWQQWELYDVPGNRDFANKLNWTIEDSWNNGDDLATLFNKAYAVLKEGSDLGAMDGEAEWHLNELIERRLKPRLES